MIVYNSAISAQENFDLAAKQAIFYKKMAANLRTQADALRALLISLNIPKEEIDEKQFAHLRPQVYHSGYAYTTTTEQFSSKDSDNYDPHISISPGRGVLD